MQKRGGFVNSILSKIRKKGLSTIVVTLIIILVSLVAVGIIWVVVKNVIQTGTEQVALGQFTLDAKIKDVNTYNSSNNVTLTVRRNAGAGEFSKINFLFYDGKDSEVITEAVSLNQLEERRFILHLIKLNVSNLISISIVPVLNQNGKDIIGNVLDKYTVGTGQSSIIIPTGCTPSLGCAALNYECGTNWQNGSCGTTFNCEPPNCTSRYGAGYTCNSSGRCVFGTCTPATCASKGYECGTGYQNGSCSGNLNCDTPNCTTRYGTGYTCNASGRCVFSSSCNLSTLAWQNNSMTSQNGWFTAVLNATPYNNSMDGVFGLSQGAQSSYSAFSALFRFSSSGYIEVYDSSTSGYRSDTSVPYTANTKYSFRFLVNITSQRYSVYVTPQGGSQSLLASNYGFRTPVTFMNNWGLIGGIGTFNVCDFAITASTPAPSCTPETCASKGYECGIGWLNGTCGGTFNCEPPTCISRYGAGYTCNATGRCVVNPTGNIINALSCSQTDVQNAINNANIGDTVVIPPGTCVWGASATYLTVNKAITLKGSGKGQTIITLSDSGRQWSAGTIVITAAATVKSMSIYGSNVNHVCAFSMGDANSWRVTDIEFVGGTAEAYFAYVGEVYGLIDNNDITGNLGSSELIFVRGPTNSWQIPHSIGGANNVFIEDNIFRGQGYVCDINSNGRAVLRYNTITGPMKIDGHGKASNSPPRGVRHVEVYHNTWTNTNNYWRALELRGGGGRIFNNVIQSSSTIWVILTEYGCTGTWPNFGNTCQCPANYPIDDQIGVGIDPKTAASEPMYLWNNTQAGTPWVLTWESTASCTGTCGPFSMTDIIQADRDYFMSTTKPAAMSAYTPYTYPHPLRST